MEGAFDYRRKGADSALDFVEQLLKDEPGSDEAKQKFTNYKQLIIEERIAEDRMADDGPVHDDLPTHPTLAG